jgi:hypothetical protein
LRGLRFYIVCRDIPVIDYSFIFEAEKHRFWWAEKYSPSEPESLSTKEVCDVQAQG